MLTEYEANFTISETSDAEGPDSLISVADKLESLLSDSQDKDSPLIAEREISASSGYAIISADRSHPRNREYIVRLEARLCTEGREVTAQIRTRFISADDNDPTDLTAGPPFVLKEIVDGYDCKIGAYEFRNEVFQVKDASTARQVMRFIKNSNRKIPVLVLTEPEEGRGNTAVEPQLALDYLLGLALVVRFKGNTSSHIREATGQACFGGAMRFYWPGDSASKFYWPEDAVQNSITQFQKDCIENAKIHDLNGDFEQIFSAARTKVIREQRDELTALASSRSAVDIDKEVSLLKQRLAAEQEAHSHTAERLKRADDRIDEIELERSKADEEHKRTIDDLLEQVNAANAGSGALSDSEKDKKLRLQNTAINQWKRRLKIAEGKNGELAAKNRDLEESKKRLEAELAAEKTPTISEAPQGVALELTGNAGIDNITILNHAINIYRNPARRYIIRALRKFCNDDNELCGVIERTMKDDNDRRRLREAIDNDRPQDGIDVGHFEHIAMDARAYFSNNTRLTTRLADVRQVRNTAAHPETNGIENIRAKDGINKVARVLKDMGNNDDSNLVEQLMPLVR